MSRFLRPHLRLLYYDGAKFLGGLDDMVVQESEVSSRRHLGALLEALAPAALGAWSRQVGASIVTSMEHGALVDGGGKLACGGVEPQPQQDGDQGGGLGPHEATAREDLLELWAG